MNAHKRVMFVDDEEGVRVSWNRYLSQHGFDVTTAENGANAISKLQAEPVDVVVSDLKMPGVDGVQLLQWIHAERPNTQFILLTGYGNDEVEKRVRELGAFDYLNKPISPDTLAAVVTAAMHLKLMPKAAPMVFAPTAAPEAAPVAALEATPEVQAKSGLRRTAEVAVGLVAAPLLGLAFVIFLPVIGFGALFWRLGETLKDLFKPAEI
ncbi:MAG: response regulator [Longimicrobiales bacterium]|nr:response regulator [Longimicrobiales bacterium]